MITVSIHSPCASACRGSINSSMAVWQSRPIRRGRNANEGPLFLRELRQRGGPRSVLLPVVREPVHRGALPEVRLRGKGIGVPVGLPRLRLHGPAGRAWGRRPAARAKQQGSVLPRWFYTAAAITLLAAVAVLLVVILVGAEESLLQAPLRCLSRGTRAPLPP